MGLEGLYILSLLVKMTNSVVWYLSALCFQVPSSFWVSIKNFFVCLCANGWKVYGGRDIWWRRVAPLWLLHVLLLRLRRRRLDLCGMKTSLVGRTRLWGWVDDKITMVPVSKYFVFVHRPDRKIEIMLVNGAISSGHFWVCWWVCQVNVSVFDCNRVVAWCFLYPYFRFQGIMLVYDVTNEKSFDNIRNWIRNIEEVSGH